MFDSLLNALSQFWVHIIPWIVVEPYEGGVMLKWGKYRGPLAPGWNLKIPLVHTAMTTHTVPAPYQLDPQALTTQDGIQVTLRATVVYQVNDLHKYLLETDGHALVLEVAQGIIAKQVSGYPWSEVHTSAFALATSLRIRRQSREYGALVKRVFFTDITRARPITLITPGQPRPKALE